MSEINDPRSTALWLWFLELAQQKRLGEPLGGIESVSGDASFRRYFRGSTDNGSWILVDAPPDREDCRPFVAVQARLRNAGVHVPELLAVDYQQGFMCLQDFGSVLLWEPLHQARQSGNAGQSQQLYQQAMDELLKIQQAESDGLPDFDAPMLQREMQLFPEWLCRGFLGLRLTQEENNLLEQVQQLLTASALMQQQIFVHRDYHSRNLMPVGDKLGVLDFQDAVRGAVTYDLVSLLKDCYISWPQETVEQWALYYFQKALECGLLAPVSQSQFLHDFHLMGVQRHLKASGIFCRLWLRDSKSGYLQDIPRTLSYITGQQYQHPALNAFADWIKQGIMPLYLQRLEELTSAEQGLDPGGLS